MSTAPSHDVQSERPFDAGRICTLFVSTSYPGDARDWRGVFIRHMAEALARRDELDLRIWAPPGEIPPNTTYAASDSQKQWLAHLMATGGIAHMMRAGGLSGWSAPLRLLRELHRTFRRERAIDLYHINWLQNALPLPANGVPLLVTVLGTDMQLVKLPGMTALVRRSLRRRRAAICPNADWMVPELQDRFGDVATVCCVPFGIDPQWFEIKHDPVPPAKWLCVSRLTKPKLGSLFEWGEAHFRDRGRELHLLGPMQEAIEVPPWVHYHGPTSAESLRERWFPTAHGLLTLSDHAEGRPQVMLEAMAAGLPVIASALPAHTDVIIDRQTGWICKGHSDLGPALGTLEDAKENARCGSRAREWARSEVGTWDDCASRYATVYRTLLEVA